MCFLKKKRVFFILFFLCLSFSTYFIASKDNFKNRSYDITQVSSLPVTEKVIIVDAGHGGEDGRCCSVIII